MHNFFLLEETSFFGCKKYKRKKEKEKRKICKNKKLVKFLMIQEFKEEII
jgi:hypothetical protein